ncbi:high-affinity nitrate transporter 2.3 [Phalaenopsis equestris]|uniref:high-affinity nitrate transporter 2.3 n=1 Tax=Phalaenopsis equestris TaxID=78828 RepID=UPI0009E4EE9F|nr:high-affinity nitrate transporter 2.3 [Phalaenopsis equestris]
MEPPPPPPKPQGNKQPPSPTFPLPVDSEHKATQLSIFSFAPPHMRSFHLCWFSFFACFCSTFASPPLLPIIRDNLSLTSTDISNAGIAAVSGAVIARIAMGSACDLIGPRLASASLTLLTSPAVFFTSVISSPSGFLLVRFFTGFSIASFVSTQYWMSSMFSGRKVGEANGLVGGWGNLGGGAIQLIMPFIYSIVRKMGCAEFTAWRVAFFVPGLVQMASALAVLVMGQDFPDGNFVELKKTGEMKSEGFDGVFRCAVSNYRGWILAITYGYCFGVELAVDNIIAEYYYDRFDLNLHTAGIIAASFGLANVVSRPGGGWISDRLAARFGMRGRLWGLWIAQTAGGILCIVLGRMGRLSLSVLVMVFFSLFVQAACGLTFGIVPFISRRSLGLVSGMTGGGGNVGAVITQIIFFKGSKYSKETGITLMGVMIVCCTLLILLIYFPQWGGMLCGPKQGFTEEDYYSSEWNDEEKEKGCHQPSLKFAQNSRNERGKRNNADRSSPNNSHV